MGRVRRVQTDSLLSAKRTSQKHFGGSQKTKKKEIGSKGSELNATSADWHAYCISLLLNGFGLRMLEDLSWHDI